MLFNAIPLQFRRNSFIYRGVIYFIIIMLFNAMAFSAYMHDEYQ